MAICAIKRALLGSRLKDGKRLLIVPEPGIYHAAVGFVELLSVFCQCEKLGPEFGNSRMLRIVLLLLHPLSHAALFGGEALGADETGAAVSKL